jgi:hypothetical protein
LIPPFLAVLDRLIKEAVERQLEAVVSLMATIMLGLAGVGFPAATVSVSELKIFRTEAHVTMMLSGGAVTGIVLPPLSDAAEPS